MSECIYEIIDFPKYHRKNLIDFFPGRFYRLGTQWKNLLLSIFHLQVLKRDPQIILGFFDPDPVLLAQQGGGAKD